MSEEFQGNQTTEFEMRLHKQIAELHTKNSGLYSEAAAWKAIAGKLAGELRCSYRAFVDCTENPPEREWCVPCKLKAAYKEME